MTLQEQLYPLVRRTFWALFLLFLDFNFNLGSAFTLPFLPNCAGWWMLLEVCTGGAALRPSLGLLKPFCGVLAVYSLLQFFPGIEAQMPIAVTLLVSILTIYTYFQFFTDLAALIGEIPGAEELSRRLLHERTVIVVLSSIMYCYDLLIHLPALAMVAMVIVFCIYVYILYQFWQLTKALSAPQPQSL